jgi:hypothetical protein
MSTTLPDHLEQLAADLDLAWSRLYGDSTGRKRIDARRLRAGLAFVLAAALGVAIWTFVGSNGPGVVERAIAAANDYPPDLIVHRVTESVEPRGKIVRQQEIWAATSPPYEQRVLTYVYGPVVEQGASGNEISSYDPATNTVYVRTVPGGTAEGTEPPETLSGAQRVAGVLKLGGAHDAGELAIGGRTVHRITVATNDGACAYDFDPSTDLGLRWACTGKDGGMSIETWAYASRSSETNASLSLIAQHPGARIDRGPVKACGPNQPIVPDTSAPPCIAYSPGG